VYLNHSSPFMSFIPCSIWLVITDHFYTH
jgi:hypothetical protein